MANLYTLSKNERLKSLKAIRHLFDHGQKFKVAPMLVYYHTESCSIVPSEPFPLKMGVSVGAKHFKKAVHRNLLKRRIREAFRQQKIPLLEYLKSHQLRMDVFFVYSYSTLTDYHIIADAMGLALKKLLLVLEKNEQHD